MMKIHSLLFVSGVLLFSGCVTTEKNTVPSPEKQQELSVPQGEIQEQEKSEKINFDEMTEFVSEEYDIVFTYPKELLEEDRMEFIKSFERCENCSLFEYMKSISPENWNYPQASSPEFVKYLYRSDVNEFSRNLEIQKLYSGNNVYFWKYFHPHRYYLMYFIQPDSSSDTMIFLPISSPGNIRILTDSERENLDFLLLSTLRRFSEEPKIVDYKLREKEYVFQKEENPKGILSFEFFSQKKNCGCYNDAEPACHVEIQDTRTGEVLQKFTSSRRGPCDEWPELGGSPIGWHDNNTLLTKSAGGDAGAASINYALYDLSTDQREDIWKFSTNGDVNTDLFFNGKAYHFDVDYKENHLVTFYRIPSWPEKVWDVDRSQFIEIGTLPVPEKWEVVTVEDNPEGIYFQIKNKKYQLKTDTDTLVFLGESTF